VKSLEADLKSPIGTSCSSFEVTAFKSIELAHYVVHFQDENDELKEDNEPGENPNPMPMPKVKPIPFHCDHCGRDGHIEEFCFRRRREERLAREMANKDMYCPSRGVPEPRVVPIGEGVVRNIPPKGRREFPTWGVPPQRDSGRSAGFGRHEFGGRSFTSGKYEYGGGGTITVLGLRGATSHGLHLVVLVILQGYVWVFHLGVIGWIFLSPLLSKWHNTGLIPFTLTLVLSRLLTLALIFYFAGGRHGEFLVDRLQLLSTHDQRSKVALQPHPDGVQGVHHFQGQWKR
jgi:hypothetical protein